MTRDAKNWQAETYWGFDVKKSSKFDLHVLKRRLKLPVIDQEVIFVTIQNLPHVSLKGSLLVHGNIRGRSSLQLPVHGSGLRLALIYYHKRHICQVAAVQLVTQASNSTEGQREKERQLGIISPHCRCTHYGH